MTSAEDSFDFAIVGAGIAGASVAAEIAPDARVVLLEAEDTPGYHATGRSAAFWTETYGGLGIQPLTTASFDFLHAPPADFSERGFLTERGAIHIADADAEPALASFAAEFNDSGLPLHAIDRSEIEQRVPGIKPWWNKAISEPQCADIDVAALHQAYLSAARRRGVELRCGARVTGAKRDEVGWDIATARGDFRAGVIVNAAGAWADHVASLAGVDPVGIVPYRRTILQLRVDPAVPAALPLVIDALGRFYFKGESEGRIWLSPHDETATSPGDAAPEEIDIAVAIDRLQKAVDWRIEAVERKWAGLRSFAPDRLPVYGYDKRVEGFFWCAGQGGFGIQTAPAAAQLCKALILDGNTEDVPSSIDPALYRPDRFR